MTVTDNGTTLSEKINQARERAHAQAGTAIAGLVKIADWLELRETSEHLAATATLLDSYTFNLMVMGRMKNGKSTLLNALLEGTTQPVAMSTGRGLMAVGTLPTTAVLTTVHYADKPSVKVQRMDGSSEDWKFDQYLHDSVLTEDNEENDAVLRADRGIPDRLPRCLVPGGRHRRGLSRHGRAPDADENHPRRGPPGRRGHPAVPKRRADGREGARGRCRGPEGGNTHLHRRQRVGR